MVETDANVCHVAALTAIGVGISCVPISEDGTKEPIGKWKIWQSHIPDRDQVDKWFSKGRTGIAFVCGAVSGGLEMLEFDDPDIWISYQEAAEAVGIKPLLDRVIAGYSERSGGGGTHLLYRVETPDGNTKLARRQLPDEEKPGKFKVKVLIETRGEGGYFVAAPSHGDVHPSGNPYVMESGSIESIVTITMEERKEFFALAEVFDEMPRQEPREESKSSGAPGDRPGDEFAERTSWADILEPHGWTFVYQRGDEQFWRRPGKDRGVSATTNYAGSGFLYVFSSSTEFDSERGYNKFGTYAILNHNGDFKDAAKSLGEKGFGKRRPTFTSFAGGKSSNNQPPPGGGQYGGSGTSNANSEHEPPQDPWPDRQPLPEPPPVPSLDPEMIPDPFRHWIVDTADIAKLPIEMVVVSALVGIGTVAGRTVGIQPWQFNNFVTVPNLWGGVVARPGWMKSFAVEEGLRPLNRLAAKASENFEKNKLKAEAALVRIEAQLEELKRQMKEEAKAGKTLDDLQTRYEQKLEERQAEKANLIERRYITQDATVEKLGEILRENPRGVLVARDELYGLLRSFERNGRENDRQFYLEAWSGTGKFTTDRIGRGTVHIPALTLSVVGGIQPGRLQPLVDEAIGGGGGDDGLISRFQIAIYPDSLPMWERPTRWPDSGARDRAYHIFEFLDELRYYDIGAKKDFDDRLPYLKFSHMAQGLADEWQDAFEHRIRSSEMHQTPSFTSHLSKYRSLFPSLALLFHLIDYAEGATTSSEVLVRPTRLAAAWCEYLELHAQKIYGVEVNRGHATAKALAAKIDAGAIVDGQSVRDIYRHGWTRLKTDEDVMDGLMILQDLGWVRLEEGFTGGRKTQLVWLHPGMRKARAA